VLTILLFPCIFFIVRKNTVNIFDYIDYRLFLAAYYRWHKKNTRRFSHRFMASKLGFASSNFLKLVMDSERNIGKESLPKVSIGLGLNKQEVEYFSYLVFFAQAKSDIDKNYYFGLIASLRSRRNVAAIGEDQFEYFSEWYHPVVRELVKGKTEPLDYPALARLVGGRVSPAKISKSVVVLKRLGLISLDITNTYVLSFPLLNTENELKSFAIRKYHKDVLAIAQQALDDIPSEEREISHLTLKISPQGFSNIKRRIQLFREEMLQLAAGDTEATDVYHVNLQLYPITRKNDHDAK
jgi:uncharacterized protein (TIGR02147 family)